MSEFTKGDFHVSDDYAFLRGGRWIFYYGYEHTNAAGDWCFVAKLDGKEVVRWSWRKLGPKKWDVVEILGTGIATFALLGHFETAAIAAAKGGSRES
jgi:hypothetical protein